MSEATTEHPPGEYAIVELFGHTTLVGRIEEVERFGAKMLAMQPLFRDTLLPVVFHGGSAIYRLTPVSAEVAWKRQPRELYQLPLPIRSIVPPLLLAMPSDSSVLDESSSNYEDEDEGDDDDRLF